MLGPLNDGLEGLLAESADAGAASAFDLGGEQLWPGRKFGGQRRCPAAERRTEVAWRSEHEGARQYELRAIHKATT
jgi:hypothetical protein